MKVSVGWGRVIVIIGDGVRGCSGFYGYGFIFNSLITELRPRTRAIIIVTDRERARSSSRPAPGAGVGCWRRRRPMRWPFEGVFAYSS